MAKKKTEKKKGPKGKKGRIAAKLQRQWGEEANEEEVKQARIRKGKRRLNTIDSESRVVSKTKNKLPRYNVSNTYGRDKEVEEEEGVVRYEDSGSHTDSDDSEGYDDKDDGLNEEQYALSSLLKNIGGTKKKKSTTTKQQVTTDHNESSTSDNESDDNDDDDDSDDSDDNTTDEESVDSKDPNNKHNHTSMMIKQQQIIGTNPFHEHFKNQEPIPENEYNTQPQPPPESIKMKKVKANDDLNSNLVLQLSGKTLEAHTTTTTTTTTNANANDENGSNSSHNLSQKAYSHVQKLLMSNWNQINKKAIRHNIDSQTNGKTKAKTKTQQAIFSTLQETIHSSISMYSDTQITCCTGSHNIQQKNSNIDAIHNVILLHVMNHILTANHTITTHNNNIRDWKRKAEEKEAKGDDNDDGIDMDDADQLDEWRDQGYTRSKVLVLLPTRSTACTFVNDILKLLGPTSSVENLDRFTSEFGNDDIEDDNLDDEDDAEVRRKEVLKQKGPEWNELFGNHVNSDDDFKIGLSFSKKKDAKKKKKDSKKKEGQEGGGGGIHPMAVKMFSDFYYSDIIIASPLGLKMSITSDNTNDSDDEEEEDADFLSSIEVVVSLHSDVMLMQNWDHVGNLMERINQQPKKSNRTDFSRVRNYLLLGQASRWRQLIMVSRFSDPYLLSTFNKHAKSLAGRMKLRRKVSADEASICNILTKVRQVFQRVPCDSFFTQGDKRLKYFTTVLLPQLLRTKQKHTLIYIPSYFDFVALRNVLLKHDIASSHFVSITEYSRGTEVNRGRARFLQGRKRIMLYTGRAHFFMRHHIKGAKHLIMFGLPEHAEFYPELLNKLSWRPRNVSGDDEEEDLDISAPASCLNLFTKYEAQHLERIVGSKHSDRMVRGEKSTFLFSS